MDGEEEEPQFQEPPLPPQQSSSSEDNNSNCNKDDVDSKPDTTLLKTLSSPTSLNPVVVLNDEHGNDPGKSEKSLSPDNNNTTKDVSENFVELIEDNNDNNQKDICDTMMSMTTNDKNEDDDIMTQQTELTTSTSPNNTNTRSPTDQDDPSILQSQQHDVEGSIQIYSDPTVQLNKTESCSAMDIDPPLETETLVKLELSSDDELMLFEKNIHKVEPPENVHEEKIIHIENDDNEPLTNLNELQPKNDSTNDVVSDSVGALHHPQQQVSDSNVISSSSTPTEITPTSNRMPFSKRNSETFSLSPSASIVDDNITANNTTSGKNNDHQTTIDNDQIGTITVKNESENSETILESSTSTTYFNSKNFDANLEPLIKKIEPEENLDVSLSTDLQLKSPGLLENNDVSFDEIENVPLKQEQPQSSVQHYQPKDDGDDDSYHEHLLQHASMDLFSKVKFLLCENVPHSDKIKKIMVGHGAKFLNYLSDTVTHFIADDPDHPSVNEAIEIFEKPVVTSQWIWLSLRANRVLPIEPFLLTDNKQRLLSNVVACPSQLSLEDLKRLWSMLTYYGGRFQLHMNSECTHLLTTKITGKKYDLAMKNTNSRIQIVTPDWIVDSIRQNKLCDEQRYHPRLLINYNHHQQQQQSTSKSGTGSNKNNNYYKQQTTTMAANKHSSASQKMSELDRNSMNITATTKSVTMSISTEAVVTVRKPNAPPVIDVSQTMDSSSISPLTTSMTKPSFVQTSNSSNSSSSTASTVPPSHHQNSPQSQQYRSSHPTHPNSSSLLAVRQQQQHSNQTHPQSHPHPQQQNIRHSSMQQQQHRMQMPGQQQPHPQQQQIQRHPQPSQQQLVTAVKGHPQQQQLAPNVNPQQQKMVSPGQPMSQQQVPGGGPSQQSMMRPQQSPQQMMSPNSASSPYQQQSTGGPYPPPQQQMVQNQLRPQQSQQIYVQQQQQIYSNQTQQQQQQYGIRNGQYVRVQGPPPQQQQIQPGQQRQMLQSPPNNSGHAGLMQPQQQQLAPQQQQQYRSIAPQQQQQFRPQQHVMLRQGVPPQQYRQMHPGQQQQQQYMINNQNKQPMVRMIQSGSAVVGQQQFNNNQNFAMMQTSDPNQQLPQQQQILSPNHMNQQGPPQRMSMLRIAVTLSQQQQPQSQSPIPGTTGGPSPGPNTNSMSPGAVGTPPVGMMSYSAPSPQQKQQGLPPIRPAGPQQQQMINVNGPRMLQAQTQAPTGPPGALMRPMIQQQQQYAQNQQMQMGPRGPQQMQFIRQQQQQQRWPQQDYNNTQTPGNQQQHYGPLQQQRPQMLSQQQQTWIRQQHRFPGQQQVPVGAGPQMVRMATQSTKPTGQQQQFYDPTNKVRVSMNHNNSNNQVMMTNMMNNNNQQQNQQQQQDPSSSMIQTVNNAPTMQMSNSSNICTNSPIITASGVNNSLGNSNNLPSAKTILVQQQSPLTSGQNSSSSPSNHQQQQSPTTSTTPNSGTGTPTGSTSTTSVVNEKTKTALANLLNNRLQLQQQQQQQNSMTATTTAIVSPSSVTVPSNCSSGGIASSAPTKITLQPIVMNNNNNNNNNNSNNNNSNSVTTATSGNLAASNNNNNGHLEQNGPIGPGGCQSPMLHPQMQQSGPHHHSHHAIHQHSVPINHPMSGTQAQQQQPGSNQVGGVPFHSMHPSGYRPMGPQQHQNYHAPIHHGHHSGLSSSPMTPPTNGSTPSTPSPTGIVGGQYGPAGVPGSMIQQSQHHSSPHYSIHQGHGHAAGHLSSTHHPHHQLPSPFHQQQHQQQSFHHHPGTGGGVCNIPHGGHPQGQHSVHIHRPGQHNMNVAVSVGHHPFGSGSYPIMSPSSMHHQQHSTLSHPYPHQQQQQQQNCIRFYGHEVKQGISTTTGDCCLIGCVFFISQTYTENPSTAKLVAGWKRKIEQFGGSVVDGSGQNQQQPTHVITEHMNLPAKQSQMFQQHPNDGKRYVTIFWLNDVLEMKRLLPPWRFYHLPVVFNPQQAPCKHHVISVTNFSQEERSMIKHLILLTGARYTDYLTQKNTILICKKTDGMKYRKAIEWQIATVNITWLQDVLFGYLDIVSAGNLPRKYKLFDHCKKLKKEKDGKEKQSPDVDQSFPNLFLKDTFKIKDYLSLAGLMAPWRVPIKYDEIEMIKHQEKIQKQREEQAELKRKQEEAEILKKQQDEEIQNKNNEEEKKKDGSPKQTESESAPMNEKLKKSPTIADVITIHSNDNSNDGSNGEATPDLIANNTKGTKRNFDDEDFDEDVDVKQIIPNGNMLTTDSNHSSSNDSSEDRPPPLKRFKSDKTTDIDDVIMMNDDQEKSTGIKPTNGTEPTVQTSIKLKLKIQTQNLNLDEENSCQTNDSFTNGVTTTAVVINGSGDNSSSGPMTLMVNGGHASDSSNSTINKDDVQFKVPFDVKKPQSQIVILLIGVKKNYGHYEQVVKQLGGKLVHQLDDARLCTHLVLGHYHSLLPKISINFLCAFAHAQHMVSIEWLDQSAKAEHFIQEAPYEYGGRSCQDEDRSSNASSNIIQNGGESSSSSLSSENHQPEDNSNNSHESESSKPTQSNQQLQSLLFDSYELDLLKSWQRRRMNLFEDLICLLTPSIIPTPSILKQIIEANGGQAVLKRLPNRRQLARLFQQETNNSPNEKKQMEEQKKRETPTIKMAVITCENDLHLITDYLVQCRHVEILNVNFVINSILKQCLDFEPFRMIPSTSTMNFAVTNPTTTKVLSTSMNIINHNDNSVNMVNGNIGTISMSATAETLPLVPNTTTIPITKDSNNNIHHQNIQQQQQPTTPAASHPSRLMIISSKS